jgi:ATP-dependent DNA helicase RecG
MKPADLKTKLQLGEDQHVEFKADCRNPDVVGRTICAFLNSGGGTVICGVTDKRELSGVADAEKGRKQLEAVLAKGLSPKAPVWVIAQEVDGVSLVVADVPAGKDVPYAFEDVVYLRQGDATRRAEIATIRDMVLRRSTEPERWERRLSPCAADTDTDAQEVLATVEVIQRTRQFKFRDTTDLSMVLDDLSMAHFGRLTQGGAVVFGKNPTRFFPHVGARAVCFAQDKADAVFQNVKTFGGPLVPVLDQLFEFIVLNTPTVARFQTGRLQRQDETLYPLDAVREGLVNALVHRDYAISGSTVRVYIYPGRLEIMNPGSLPTGITPETLLTREHTSVLRNPDIANVLYLRGFMEMLGRGSLMILDSCRKRGLPDPVWTTNGSSVTLTLHAPKNTGKTIADGTKSALSGHQVDILRNCLQDNTLVDLMAIAKRTDRTKFNGRVRHAGAMPAGLYPAAVRPWHALQRRLQRRRDGSAIRRRAKEHSRFSRLLLQLQPGAVRE